jgi:hypothetical protein
MSGTSRTFTAELCRWLIEHRTDTVIKLYDLGLLVARVEELRPGLVQRIAEDLAASGRAEAASLIRTLVAADPRSLRRQVRLLRQVRAFFAWLREALERARKAALAPARLPREGRLAPLRLRAPPSAPARSPAPPTGPPGSAGSTQVGRGPGARAA